MPWGIVGNNEVNEKLSEKVPQDTWLVIPTGHRINIRTAGWRTENRVTVIDVIEPQSSPPPFTRHDFVEIFYIKSGILTFMFLDEAAFECEAGGMIKVSSGKPHSFWNQHTDPVEITLVCAPALLDRFFVASHALLNRVEKEGDNDITVALDALRRDYGLTIVAPAPIT